MGISDETLRRRPEAISAQYIANLEDEVLLLRAEVERLTAIIKAIEERRLVLQSDGRWMASKGTLADFGADRFQVNDC